MNVTNMEIIEITANTEVCSWCGYNIDSEDYIIVEFHGLVVNNSHLVRCFCTEQCLINFFQLTMIPFNMSNESNSDLDTQNE